MFSTLLILIDMIVFHRSTVHSTVVHSTSQPNLGATDSRRVSFEPSKNGASSAGHPSTSAYPTKSIGPPPRVPPSGLNHISKYYFLKLETSTNFHPMFLQVDQVVLWNHPYLMRMAGTSKKLISEARFHLLIATSDQTP